MCFLRAEALELDLLLGVGKRVLAESFDSMDKATCGVPPQSAVVEAFCAMATTLYSVPFYRTFLRANEVGKTLNLIRDLRYQTLSTVAERVVGIVRRAGATMPEDELLEVAHLLSRLATALIEDPIPGVPADDEQAV